jgi:hypothetical protein
MKLSRRIVVASVGLGFGAFMAKVRSQGGSTGRGTGSGLKDELREVGFIKRFCV